MSLKSIAQEKDHTIPNARGVWCLHSDAEAHAAAALLLLL
jgi:hypothetical protein